MKKNFFLMRCIVLKFEGVSLCFGNDRETFISKLLFFFNYKFYLLLLTYMYFNELI